MAKSKDANFVSDLAGSQLFIDADELNPVITAKESDAAIKRIQKGVAINALEIDFGRGRLLKIDPTNPPTTTND